jgi:hypothetical protein
MEESKPSKRGGFGLFVGTPNNWYNFVMLPYGEVLLTSSQLPKERVFNESGSCCPTTHLLGARVDGSEIHFYLDGEWVTSLPDDGIMWDPGFVIWTESEGIKVKVDNFWVKFVE